MAPPSFALPTSQHGFLFPKVFPPLPPPPPPPPPYLYRNLRNSGNGWPMLPRIPRAQHSCRPKKIINICDPQTGQDITEEILSSVNCESISKKSPLKKVAPPLRPHNNMRRFTPMSSPLPMPLGFVRKAPSPSQFIMKCNPDAERMWPYEDQHWCRNGFPPFMGSCSWPPNLQDSNEPYDFKAASRKRYQSVNSNKKNVVQYNRDILLSLRYHPLALAKPEGLPDLDVIKNEVLSEDKIDKNCHYGTQTSMPRAFRPSANLKQNGSFAFHSKSKPKAPSSNGKTKPNSMPKKEIIRKNKITSQEAKSAPNLDRGDSKETEISKALEELNLV